MMQSKLSNQHQILPIAHQHAICRHFRILIAFSYSTQLTHSPFPAQTTNLSQPPQPLPQIQPISPIINNQYQSLSSMPANILLQNITVKNNPCPFTQNFCFQIALTVKEQISCPLRWKIIYVGSASSQQYDQVLSEFELPPCPANCTIEAAVECTCPDIIQIPEAQILSVTAIILTANFNQQQFLRIGFYVHNQLIDRINRPESQDRITHRNAQQLLDRVCRTIIADKPRITTFDINWGANNHVIRKTKDSSATKYRYFISSARNKLQDNLSHRHDEQSSTQGSNFVTPTH